MRTKCLYVLLLICLCGCSVKKPFYNSEEASWQGSAHPNHGVEYQVYLLGGLDDEGTGAGSVLTALQHHISGNDTNHATIILGENIYKKGLPASGKKNRIRAEKEIDARLAYLKNDKGKLLIVAGSKAGDVMKPSQSERTRNFVEEKLGRKNIFYPESGCPGPAEIELSKNVVAVALNTNWMLQDEEKRNPDCEIDNEEDWINEIKDVIDNNQRKNVLVLGYHPLVNMGNYGGFYSPTQHIFPLTDINKNLYIPLPLIGSLYPVFRSGIGTRNDAAFPAYKTMRKELVRSFEGFNNLIYASGHEHNLQYSKYRDQDYIVTNSSDDTRWAGKNKRGGFTYSEKGFARLTFYENREVWVDFFVPDKNTPGGKIIFRKMLRESPEKVPLDSTIVEPRENVADSIVTIAADKSLEAGKFRRLWLGDHYRTTWATEVKVPVIDLQVEKGGLEIIKKGGGFQTKSLQLKDSKGEEHTLRSVIKYPERLLGSLMTNTLAADVVKDQTSSNYPYAPYIIDDLAESAGILHTDPKLVFIPNDRQLAEFRKDFANTLALFEKRADGKITSDENLGYVEKAISSDKMMKALKKSNKVMVDDLALLKSRLFDMWINDWDRHEGQWRWGLKECDGENAARCSLIHATKNYYVPIPKDRDQALSKYDGIIPRIATRKWALRKFQHFDEDIRDVPGINFNARNFDHAFLSELSREEWMTLANELKAELTDEVIDAAVKKLPPEIYALDGEEISRILKARRNRIPSFAEEQYEFLSQYVDVKGSSDKEHFVVERLNDDSTFVAVYADTSGKRGSLLFDRMIITGETKELRLYGMDGDDVFHVSGETDKGIIVRIIGGDDKDSIVDNSKVSGWCKKTKIYDLREGNVISASSESRKLLSNDDEVNDYDYKSYRYNLVAPALFFGLNRDDGLFLGGGVVIKKQGFRKEPYSWMQRIVANVAVRERAFNLRYRADFINVMGKWGISADADILAPKSNTNFFGLGNETPRFNDDDEFYRLRYNYFSAFAGVNRLIGKHHIFKFGPAVSHIEIEKTNGRFISSDAALPYTSQLEAKNYGGLSLEYNFQRIDDSVLTFRGIKWMISGVSQTDMAETSKTSLNFESQVSLYIPFGSRATIAFRAGGATRVGDFEFFQANTLGWQNIKRENANLRGYLRGRYAGRSTAYFNTDLRVKLWTVKTYLFPAHLGLLGFYDSGRVWQDHEKSKKWHTSYGGGIWFDPFAMTVVNLTYAVGKEDKLFSLSIGFLF